MTGISQKCAKLKQIELSNLLSFGPDMESLDLESGVEPGEPGVKSGVESGA